MNIQTTAPLLFLPLEDGALHTAVGWGWRALVLLVGWGWEVERAGMARRGCGYQVTHIYTQRGGRASLIQFSCV